MSAVVHYRVNDGEWQDVPATIAGTDVTGDADTNSTVAVVCVPFGTTNLAAGQSAGGYYFDAVQGSQVKVLVKTEAKQPRRSMRVQVLDVDGNAVLSARVYGGKGQAGIARFTAPSTGRFYCVIASDDNGAASRIAANAVLTPTKKGGGDNGPDNFVAPDVFRAKFGALGGATLTFTATPDRSGLSIRPYLYLIDPNGDIVALLDSEVTAKGKGFVIKKVLPETSGNGTWQVLITANAGPQGHFRFTYRIKEPRGVVYSQD